MVLSSVDSRQSGIMRHIHAALIWEYMLLKAETFENKWSKYVEKATACAK